MRAFIQNHPGTRDTKPKPNPEDDQKSMVTYSIIILASIPFAIAFPVLKRLSAIGKIDSWVMYMVLVVIALLSLTCMIAVIRKRMLKNVTEQKKYYRLAGGLSWLPQEKRAALQLEAQYCYHTGSWVETLEYWPSEVRLPGKTRFTTFQIVTKEDRLAANDQAWSVLSERSYTERIDALFAGLHSRLFASDKQVMPEENRKAMIARLGELTQLPESYIASCWEPQGSRPAALVWGFDLHRITELSRTSFMAGVISEQKAWEQILKASDYAHALFDSSDDFFNNFRLGHAYWCNDFKRTNEVAQMQKSYNNDCKWPIKGLPWNRKDHSILPEVIQNGCRDYVEEEVKKNTRNTVGFQPGNNSNDPVT